MDCTKKKEKYLKREELERMLEIAHTPESEHKGFTIRIQGPWSRTNEAIRELYEQYKDDASVKIKGYLKAKPGEQEYNSKYGCVYFNFTF